MLDYEGGKRGRVEFRVLGTLEVVVDGQSIDLGPLRQRSLLALLLINANRVVATDRILEEIWGIESKEVSTRTVDTHVSRLRKKLALNADNGWKLAAIYQHGYRMERIEGGEAPAS